MIRVILRVSAARVLYRCLLGWAALGFVAGSPASAQPGPTLAEREVPLAELLAYAESHAPATQLALRRRGYGAAARAEADPLFRHNPTIGFAMGPRFGAAGATSWDLQVSLAQPIELAGERGLRLDAAARLEGRLDAETAASRWEVRQRVTALFRSAALARGRVAIAERLARFAGEMLATTRRRLAAGDATSIEVRVAEADAAQARQAQLVAEQDLRSLRIGLAEVTGWSLTEPPLVPSELEPPDPVPTLAAVMRVAAGLHPELRVRRAAVAEAHVRVALAEREAWPTPVLGVQYAREGSPGSQPNSILLGSIELPLPFWQHNHGERARARVDEAVARAEEGVAARALSSRIARAHSELSSAAERVSLFTTGVSPSLESSLTLLERGFGAGELPLLGVAAARERFLQAQLGALDAYADYYGALVELEGALGAELPSATPPAGGAP